MTEKTNELTKSIALPAQNHSDEILELIRGGLTPAKMLKRLSDFHARDIAEVFPLLSADERKRLYQTADACTLAGILEYCEDAELFLRELNPKMQAALLSQMESQDAQSYLQQLSRQEKNTLFDLMDEDACRRIALLDSFDEEEIGSCMSTNFVKIPVGLTVREAMRELIRQAADNDNISTIYVVEADGVLFGAIDLKALIIARENTPLDEVIMSSYPYVYADELIEDCIERLKEYSEDSIPVLDRENKLSGVLTANDIANLADKEICEDYAKLAGLPSEEDLHEPLGQSVKKRLPWLTVLMVLGLFVSSVVGLFESVIARMTVIIGFQSLILDMAGNVGTQSLAVTIRVLMDEQIGGRDKLRLVWKEAKVGFVNGLLLGGLSVILIGAYLMLIKGQTAQLAIAVALCIAASLVVAIVFSGVCGTAVPMLFQKFNVDPAVASGPLITTINDLIAVVTYYGLAWVLLVNALGL